MKSRYTVKKSSDFRRIYARGKSEVTPFMVVYCRRNSLGVTRTGFTVSSKLGNAVVRNRIRRRLREICRLNNSRIAPGFDIIIVARSRCVNAEYSLLNGCFCEVCERLGIMK